jgi:hypothetical protein
MLTALLACFLSIAITVTLAMDQLHQIPMIALVLFAINGMICIYYTLLWLSARIDVFDPLGLFGMFGIIYYLISPIGQIGADYWPFIPSLSGRDEWFNLWAALNTAGLLIFAGIIGRPTRMPRPLKREWVIDYKVFRIAALVALLVTFAFQLYIFSKFGGVSGFVQAFSMRQEQRLGRTESDPFSDMGFPLVIAESFKYVFAMCCIIYFRKKSYAHTMPFFALLMIFLLIIFLVFGGLRGSRSATIFSLVFAAGMYRFWIRNIPMKVIVLGVAFVFSFLNIYYWYKIAGTSGVSAMFDKDARGGFNSARQDNTVYVLSRDLGRLDVQTLAMITHEEQGVPFQYGATYLGAPFTVIPTAVVPWKPQSLARVKSDVVFGPGKFDPKYKLTTIVFGLVGEAFINFGYIGILLAYAALGFVTARIRRYVYGLQALDARRLLLPVFCLLPVNILLTDAGVLVMILTRALLIPSILVFISIRSRKIDTLAPDIGEPVSDGIVDRGENPIKGRILANRPAAR